MTLKTKSCYSCVHPACEEDVKSIEAKDEHKINGSDQNNNDTDDPGKKEQ